jgi:hypothetical protein
VPDTSRRIRASRDEEYTYFPAQIREKSPLLLVHTNEVSWTQILFATALARNRLDLIIVEQLSEQQG